MEKVIEVGGRRIPAHAVDTILGLLALGAHADMELEEETFGRMAVEVVRMVSEPHEGPPPATPPPVEGERSDRLEGDPATEPDRTIDREAWTRKLREDLGEWLTDLPGELATGEKGSLDRISWASGGHGLRAWVKTTTGTFALEASNLFSEKETPLVLLSMAEALEHRGWTGDGGVWTPSS